ncbi:MAG: GNAT family N-acetyltransferase [Planctomycetota bacterium]
MDINVPGCTIRAATPADRFWIARVLTERWHSPHIVSRGRVHAADHLPALIAENAADKLGLATYAIASDQCELVTLDSLAPGLGIGSALLAATAAAARAAGCRRLWLITTNDNLAALRFYQKRGLVLVAVHRDALAESRRRKPEISLIGMDGIPLRDELELELLL